MSRFQRRGGLGQVVALTLAVAASRAYAQEPTLNTGAMANPGGSSSALGPTPGTRGNTLGSPPGSGGGVFSSGPGSNAPISGRVGATGPHVPSSVTSPAQGYGPANQPTAIAAPLPRATFSAPSYGTYALPSGPEDDGPPDGLTLDDAIVRVLRDNLDLRSKALEIPQAQADVLGASLRANPVLYADAQLVPYGRYTRDRPGGETQYDVNVSYPVDVSGKRRARTVYATTVRNVIEAQYQDAARNAIDAVYNAYVNVLAARQTVRYSRSSVEGFGKVLKATDELYRNNKLTVADVLRIQTQLNAAEIGLFEAEEQLRKTKRDLGTLLNFPAERAADFEVRGTIQDLAPPPPPLEELVRTALALRPDLVSFRMGVRSAQANVKYQLTNRFNDVYVLYQPYTYQDNSPFGEKSPTSWALGATITMPIYNRNQGGILRAKLNVTQSQVQVSGVERQTINDVQNAFVEYQLTAKMVDRVRTVLVPAERQILDTTYRLYTDGEVNVLVFLNAQRDYQAALKQFLDTVVRHRRSMLAVNTVVGQRIFP